MQGTPQYEFLDSSQIYVPSSWKHSAAAEDTWEECQQRCCQDQDERLSKLRGSGCSWPQDCFAVSYDTVNKASRGVSLLREAVEML